MISEWLKIMLEEIDRKRIERESAAADVQSRRLVEQRAPAPAPDSAPVPARR